MENERTILPHLSNSINLNLNNENSDKFKEIGYQL